MTILIMANPDGTFSRHTFDCVSEAKEYGERYCHHDGGYIGMDLAGRPACNVYVAIRQLKRAIGREMKNKGYWK